MSEIPYQINPDCLKPWNELPRLPIREELYRNIAIYEQLAKARAALGQLEGRSVAIPNPEVLINTISLQEAKASSAVENIFTTDDELYKAYNDQAGAGFTPVQSNTFTPAQSATKEILRYREALWTGHSYLKEAPGFTNDYFIKTFQIIKQTNESIRSSISEIVIRQGGSEPNAGKIIYTPPRGKGIVEEKLTNLADFVNDDKSFTIDPLIKMAIAHYQFEVIHPFKDGNGRTGRIFNVHCLTQKGLLDLPILFLSKYIIENKEDYYAGLTGVWQRGDWQTWLLYMLRAVEATSNLTYIKINSILSAKDAILNHITKEDKKIRNPDQLATMLFTQPYITVKNLTRAKIYSEMTARNYLERLCKMQIIEKRIIGGHHYYLNRELYRILAEN